MSGDIMLQLNEVAIIMVGDQFQPRDIVLHRRNHQLINIRETHHCYNALQYPIIFWDGADGYRFNVKMVNPIESGKTSLQRIHSFARCSCEYKQYWKADYFVIFSSPHHMQEYAQDAMAYVHHYGCPDLFITFMFNPAWNEIQQLLLPGISQVDRHDITACFQRKA
ncbi:helitron_like_N domain-containing protein [Trichonephila clavipes]|nr:helitron_like_N domain-containing protein [Trichonephila clavipes]